jgi:molybdate transport system substrate-binding protein
MSEGKSETMSDTLIVLSARAVKSAVAALAQKYSAATGVRVECDFAPVGAVEKKLANGAHADVLILSDAAIVSLVTKQNVIPASVRVLGRTSIGVCVRDGAPRPDIATPESFKSLLLSSPTIAVSDVAVGGTAARYLPQLFERMGISAALEPKLVRCAGGGDVTERVARGAAAIGITFVSEMLAVGGATVIGPLPDAYGNDTTYCAGIMASTAKRASAAALVAMLSDTSNSDVWRAAGFVSGSGGSKF